MSKKPELNYDQFNSVKVYIGPEAPGPVVIRDEVSFEDLSWNPFNRVKVLREMVNKVKIFHEVKIEQKYLSDQELNGAVSVLREYYRRNPEKLRDADKLADIARMSDQEIKSIVNTWIGIVQHFGPSAHYRREFLAMMRPVLRAFHVAGL